MTLTAHDLIELLIEDRIADDQLAALEKAVLSDRAAARAYITALHRHAAIARLMHPADPAHRLDAGSPSAWRATEVTPSKPTPTLSGASPRSVWYAKGFRVQGSGFSFKARAALAALIVIAASLLFDFLPSTPHSQLPAPHSAAPASYAILSDLSNDAQFADGERSLGEGLTTPIHLTAGRAQLMFKSTAVVDLTGPCEFEMIGPNRGRLNAGKLEAYVPENAHGFSVALSDGSRVVDLGTRFEITATEDHRSWVNVTQGRVRIEPRVGAMQIVAAGGQMLIDDGRCIIGEPINLPLVNADFEDASLDDGQILARQTIAGWNLIGDAPVGVFNPGSRQYGEGESQGAEPIAPRGLSGSNAGFIFNGGRAGLEQTTPYFVESARQYVLRVAVGHRSQNVAATGYRIELLAGDAVLGFVEARSPAGPRGRFTDVIVTVEPLPPDDPRVGRPLIIRLVKQNGAGYFDFDNVRLQSFPPNASEASLDPGSSSGRIPTKENSQ
ncbi:MAG: hypothetical protein GC162_08945 [Planctomycetes bacterium]|nr:hypothetical protein [Planctomycetota bacterium]